MTEVAATEQQTQQAATDAAAVAVKAVADKATADKAAADAAAKAGTNGHDWRADIADPKVKEFAAQHASVTDLATSALGLRQKLSKAVVIPGKDAKPEDKAAFRKAWGVPDDPTKYELAPGEGQALDEGFKGLMSKTFHDLDINGEQAKGLNTAWNGYLAEMTSTRDAALTKARENATTALRKEWPGGEFDANVKHAKAAAKAFGGEDFLAWVEKATIDGIAVGDHPHFLKTFAQVGRRMGEDSSHIGLTPEDSASAQEQISKLRSERHEASVKGDQGAVTRINAKMEELYAKANPGSRTT